MEYTRTFFYVLTALTIAIAPFTASVAPVFSEELVISGNGANSENEINVESKTESSVEQSNNIEVENKVEVEANTGNNEAGGNTSGDVSIDTGNINTATNIDNNDINTSEVNYVCCPEEPSGTEISGNGAGSKNEIKVEHSNKVNVDVDQNVKAVVVAIPANGQFSAVILDNEAVIENEVEIDANTGENFTEGNIGDVAITTGDIDIDTNIKNEGINISEAAIICCPTITPTITPTVTPTVITTPTTTPTPQAGGAAAEATPTPAPFGEVLGAAAAGEILPVSGSNWLLFATILSLIMFFTGIFLRSLGHHPKIRVLKLP